MRWVSPDSFYLLSETENFPIYDASKDQSLNSLSNKKKLLKKLNQSIRDNRLKSELNLYFNY